VYINIGGDIVNRKHYSTNFRILKDNNSTVGRKKGEKKKKENEGISRQVLLEGLVVTPNDGILKKTTGNCRRSRRSREEEEEDGNTIFIPIVE